MKHWFYDSNGKELNVYHYKTIEQQKQFLEEFDIPHIEVGYDVVDKIDLDSVCDNLGELLSILGERGINPNDVSLVVDYEKDYDYEREFVAAHCTREATEEDVVQDIRNNFHKWFEVMKQDFQNLEWTANKLGYVLVEKERK